jgi:hypothetical protein
MFKVALWLSLALAPPAFARGGHSSSSTQQHNSYSSPKTVHVRSYEKKDGTRVDSYNRRPPGQKQADEGRR